MLRPGDRVDRYVVERELGRGGQASVWQVRHHELGVVRALKLLEAGDAVTRARLMGEGRLLAQLRHRNLVEVIDVFAVEGAPALLMEFVGGGTLQERISTRGLSIAEVETFFLGILAGVEVAHAAGVVHRDLKPANVLLDEQATPKVADFGIARFDEGDGLTMTRAGLGTPMFMAPEQARDARRVDLRADVWSLGAMLYAMLAGFPPFAGSVWWEVIAAAEAGRYAPVERFRPETPAAWRASVEACLRVDPASRPADIPALRAIFLGAAAPPQRAAATVVLDDAGPGPTGSGAGVATGARGSRTGGAAATMVPGADEEEPEAWRSGAHLSRAFGAPADDADGPATGASPTAAPPTAAPPPAASPAAGAGVFALVVDDAGLGHVVEVLVDVQPGAGEVSTPLEVARDTAIAAQVAVAAALGPAAGRRRVLWTVRGAGFKLHGSSLGLALAVATLGLRPAGWAFTGGVDLDGRIAPVQGLPAKLRAAAAAGLRQVGVPPGTAPAEGVVPFASLAELRARFHPTRPRPWLPAAAVLLPSLATFLGLFSGLDARAHYPLLRAGGQAVEPSDVVAVRLPATADLRALRPEWPALLARLAAAGPRAILLDLSFGAETEHDAAIAAAIAGLGLPVLVPVVVEGDRVIRPTAPIAEAARLVHVVSLTDPDRGWIRRGQVRVHDAEGRAYWHAAAVAAGALAGGGEPRLDGPELVIGPLRNAQRDNGFALAPAGAVPVVDIDGDLAGLRDRLAIVGALRGDKDLQRTPDGPRYGAEVLAVQAQTLLRQRAPRELGPAIDALVSALTGLATLAAGRRLAAIAPLLAVLALAVALATGGTLLGLVGPALAAAAVGLWRWRGAR